MTVTKHTTHAASCYSSSPPRLLLNVNGEASMEKKNVDGENRCSCIAVRSQSINIYTHMYTHTKKRCHFSLSLRTGSKMLSSESFHPCSKTFTKRAGHLTWRPERVLRGSGAVTTGEGVWSVGSDDEGFTGGVGSGTAGKNVRSLNSLSK